MARRPRFAIIFAPETVEHIKAIESQHHSVIRKAIDEQLSQRPDVPTRNRKPLEAPAPFEATWELRLRNENRTVGRRQGSTERVY